MIDRPRRILILGTGRLAAVLARASASASSLHEIALMGRNEAARDEIIAANPRLLRGDPIFASHTDLVVPAVTPQAYEQVIRSLGPHLSPSAIVVSVTNAVALDEIAQWTSNPVVKVIPTIAQLVRRGATPVVAGPGAGASHIRIVTEWLGGFSLPVEVAECDVRVASNVAGSAVAAIACFARAFVVANARCAHGLDRASLETMMAESLVAVGELALAGINFDQAIDTTATPGGVTEATIGPLANAIDDICREMVATSFRCQARLQRGSAAHESDR